MVKKLVPIGGDKQRPVGLSRINQVNPSSLDRSCSSETPISKGLDEGATSDDPSLPVPQIQT